MTLILFIITKDLICFFLPLSSDLFINNFNFDIFNDFKKICPYLRLDTTNGETGTSLET